MTTPPVPAVERRASERFSPEVLLWCRLLPAGDAELPAVLLDLSTGGAGLSLGASLPVGLEILLRLVRLDQSPLEVAGRVVYCIPHEGGAIVGCRFREPPGELEVRAVLRVP
jgi:hypothetical protein